MSGGNPPPPMAGGGGSPSDPPPPRTGSGSIMINSREPGLGSSGANPLLPRVAPIPRGIVGAGSPGGSSTGGSGGVGPAGGSPPAAVPPLKAPEPSGAPRSIGGFGSKSIGVTVVGGLKKLIITDMRLTTTRDQTVGVTNNPSRSVAPNGPFLQYAYQFVPAYAGSRLINRPIVGS